MPQAERCIENTTKIGVNENNIENIYIRISKMEKTINKTFWFVVTTFIAICIRLLPMILNFITNNVNAINK